MTSKQHRKVCTTLDYIEHLFILASAVTGCFNIWFCFFSWYLYGSYKFCSRIKSEIMPHQHPSDLTLPQLAEELPKPIFGKFEKWKVHF